MSNESHDVAPDFIGILQWQHFKLRSERHSWAPKSCKYALICTALKILAPGLSLSSSHVVINAFPPGPEPPQRDSSKCEPLAPGLLTFPSLARTVKFWHAGIAQANG